MKTSNTNTPISENSYFFKKEGVTESPSYYVIMEEKNDTKPSSELFRVRLGATSKEEANDMVEKAKDFLPEEVQDNLNIRIEKIKLN